MRLARDEMANLGFAVERRYTDDSGSPVDRREAWLRNWRPEPPTPPGDPPRYLVQTEVPDYWIPLLPERTPDEALRLRLVPMASDVTGQPLPVQPRGRLLTSTPDRLWLHDEEVPRDGARVTRNRRYARWLDGSIHRWTVRRKHTGQGEGSSGLTFDSLR